MATPNMFAENFEKAFRPNSVSILGASNDNSRISGRALHYILKAGYKGAIYPVNNKRNEVQGLKAYPSLAALPETPDIALIGLPMAAVKDAVAECADKGVGAAIIYASGFAEVSEEGRTIQAEIAEIASKNGLRLFGPNCLGLFNVRSGFMGSFTSALDSGVMIPGSVAIASQSGAYGGHLAYLFRERNIGMSYWVSTGNEAVTDVADCIAWLAQQDDVSVIAAYAEGVRDGAKFIDALRIAHECKKPVVFVKVGGSSVGAEAAQSHTASLSGANAVYDAIFREYGVYRARTTEEQVDIAYACSRGVYPKSRSTGIVTVSGGFGIQLCDAAEEYALDINPLPEHGREKLRTINPNGSDNNPCDVTAGVLNKMEIITDSFKVMYQDGGYDSIVGSFTMLPSTPTYGMRIREAIQEGTKEYLDRPTLLCMEAGEEIVRNFEDAGFLVFKDSHRAMKAVAALADIREGMERALDKPEVDMSLKREFAAASLSEAAAQDILSGAGVPFLPSAVVNSAADAAAAAARIGFPVVMKIVSAQILHKTEIGGVILNIADAKAAEAAYATLMERTADKAPEAAIDGVLVIRMAPRGIETIIGVNRDPVFGPIVMFGLGGIFAEVFRDVTFRSAPFSVADAKEMIASIKGAILLKKFRGRPATDIDALANLLHKVSLFAAANAETIDSIDLNPVVVLEEGQGVFSLDAVIIPKAE